MVPRTRTAISENGAGCGHGDGERHGRAVWIAQGGRLPAAVGARHRPAGAGPAPARHRRVVPAPRRLRARPRDVVRAARARARPARLRRVAALAGRALPAERADRAAAVAARPARRRPGRVRRAVVGSDARLPPRRAGPRAGLGAGAARRRPHPAVRLPHLRGRRDAQGPGTGGGPLAVGVPVPAARGGAEPGQRRLPRRGRPSWRRRGPPACGCTAAPSCPGCGPRRSAGRSTGWSPSRSPRPGRRSPRLPCPCSCSPPTSPSPSRELQATARERFAAAVPQAEVRVLAGSATTWSRGSGRRWRPWSATGCDPFCDAGPRWYCVPSRACRFCCRAPPHLR